MEGNPPIEETPVGENQIVTPPQPVEEIINCNLCRLPLHNETPILETLCHHKFHTACFMIETEHDFHCPLCRICLLGPNHIQIHREQRDQRRRDERIAEIQSQFVENKVLVKDFKLIK